jgi:coatomer subunit beta'
MNPGHYLLGYIPQNGRIYLVDKDINVVSYGLNLSLVEYQSLVLREEMDAADDMLSSIPADQLPKVSRFLETQGNKSIVQFTNSQDTRRKL